MLLTSSQISMGISSAIVFIFSTILFLSGYILQQQTVHDLRTILKPPADPTASSIPLGVAEAIVKPPDPVRWDKVGYVQIVQRHADVCASSIIFAELARQESKARRVLLYPRDWDADTETSYAAKQRKHSMRFLRKIAARYEVSLRPVDTESDTTESSPVLPLNRIYSLVDLQTLLYLNPSGVIYNATTLDELFTLDPTGAGLHFLSAESALQNALASPAEGEATTAPLAIMLKPSMTTYQNIRKIHSASLSLADLTLATGSSAKYAATIFGETFSLQKQDVESSLAPSRSTLDLPAYMRFSDPGILGPDYDIPQTIWVGARPGSQPERGIWEDVYADYRAQRMAVCGLEVEPMPKVAVEDDKVEEVLGSAVEIQEEQEKEKVAL